MHQNKQLRAQISLAIGRMFGGIPESFFGTYHDNLPKAHPVEQYELRSELYQLYHYLNHTVLFGVRDELHVWAVTLTSLPRVHTRTAQ